MLRSHWTVNTPAPSEPSEPSDPSDPSVPLDPSNPSDPSPSPLLSRVDRFSIGFGLFCALATLLVAFPGTGFEAGMLTVFLLMPLSGLFGLALVHLLAWAVRFVVALFEQAE